MVVVAVVVVVASCTACKQTFNPGEWRLCAEVTAHRAPTAHAGIKWYHIGCVNAHLPDKGTGLIGYTSLTVGERERLDEVMHARKEKGEPVLLPFQEQAPHAPPGVLATVADGPAGVGEATQGTYESQGACAGPPDAGAQATGDRAQLLARPAASSDAAKLEDDRGDEQEEGLREEDEEYVDEEPVSADVPLHLLVICLRVFNKK